MFIKNTGFNLLMLFLGGLVLLFIIAPLAGLFLSVNTTQITDTIHDKEVVSSIRLTLWASMVASICFGIGAIPLAYFLSRKKFALRSLVLGIINIPIVIPHSAAGIAILGFISRDSNIGALASSVGLNLVGNPAAIVTAMAFVSLPFLINAAIEAFNGVPVELEKAAQNLGASNLSVFFKITLPLAWRGILTGFTMMWARGMSEFGAVVIVAYHPMVTPVLIWDRFASFGLKYATPVAVIFIAVTLSFFVLMRLLSKPLKNDS